MAILAVNFGATNTRVGAVEGGTILEQVHVPTDSRSYELSLVRTRAAMDNLQQRYDCVAVGVCVAGSVDEEGVITGAGNLPAWVSKGLKDDIQLFTNLPVVVMNDAKAEALGAFAYYSRPLTFVGLGTGVGVSRVEDGKATATEHGHDIIVAFGGRRCGCGGYGHLEAYLGGDKLAEWYGVEHAGQLTNQQWEEVLPVAAAFIRNLSNDGPAGELIVIGGGVGEKQFSKAGANRLPILQELVNQLVSTTLMPTIKVAPDADNLALHGLAFAAGQLLVA